MSELKIYADNAPSACETLRDVNAIAAALSDAGIHFERWEASQPLTADCTQDEVLAAYRADVDRLMADNGFQSADVVSLTPDHPDKVAFRNKFLSEHTHSEDEVRFFVDGSGMFYIHKNDKVFQVLCEKGDLLSVPANTKHWFDMGPAPFFKCIRLFTNPEGWVANFTDDNIADNFPKMGD
jgi:1,2-dihydroxy-3-keto-5-methylthiopentene dioxygenase